MSQVVDVNLLLFIIS